MEDRPSSNPGSTGTYDMGSTGVGSSGADTGTGMTDQVRSQAQNVGQQAREKAGQMMGQVGDQIKSQLTTQKDNAAGGLGSVAQALRTTGEQLREQDQAPVSRYAEAAADMVDGVSGYLRERDVDDMLGEVERFAREQPALFLGSAFVLGFMAARFLKSSSTRNRAIVPMDQSYSVGAVSRPIDYGTTGTGSTYGSGTAYTPSPVTATDYTSVSGTTGTDYTSATTGSTYGSTGTTSGVSVTTEPSAGATMARDSAYADTGATTLITDDADIDAADTGSTYRSS